MERGIEINNKLVNNVNDYLRFTESLLKKGYIFEKKIHYMHKTSSVMFLPARLAKKTFKVILVPVDDGYEVSEPSIEKKELDKSDRLLKETKRDLERIKLLEMNDGRT